MDLLDLFKKSIRDPLHFSHLLVIFVTGFIFLTTGLLLYSGVTYIYGQTKSNSACDTQTKKAISGKASYEDEVVYSLDYSGNSQCFLSAFVTWTDKASTISFWLYEPNGNVRVIEPNQDQTHTLVYSSSPVNHGTWRLVIKTDSATKVPFRGEIAIK